MEKFLPGGSFLTQPFGTMHKSKLGITSPGRKFALLEGLSHDLKSVPDRFIMSILCGRCGTVNYHPVLNLIN